MGNPELLKVLLTPTRIWKGRRQVMKVKLFSSPDHRILAKEINQWLEDNSWAKIINITQSSGTSTVISIWYDEPNVPILG